MYRLSRALMPVTATAVLFLAACASDDTFPEADPSSQGGDDAPQSSQEDSTTEDSSASECYVHLFDDDDFDTNEDNFKLTEPGRYGDLADLPGAKQDWTDEADGLKVGADATVTVWSETEFNGQKTELEAGSEHRGLDEEPSSLELSCD